MLDISFPAAVAAHGENQPSGRSNNASGAPDKVTTKGSHLLEAPWRDTLRGRAAGTGIELDPELSSEVAGEDVGEHVRLVSDPGSERLLGYDFVEEGTVDAGLNLRVGRAWDYMAHTVVDEGVGPVGVVDVPGAMKDIGDLIGPGEGTKRG